MRLIKNWLNELPVKYRTEALNAHNKHNKNSVTITNSMHRALEYGFKWSDTPVTTKDQWRGLMEIYRRKETVIK